MDLGLVTKGAGGPELPFSHRGGNLRIDLRSCKEHKARDVEPSQQNDDGAKGSIGE